VLDISCRVLLFTGGLKIQWKNYKYVSCISQCSYLDINCIDFHTKAITEILNGISVIVNLLLLWQGIE